MLAWPSTDQLPPPPRDELIALEPLGPEHNSSDHVAWMSSIDHVLATPGFAVDNGGTGNWPTPMSLEQNLDDLQMHALEFAAGEAYAYTVLEVSSGEVVGCVYVDPDDQQPAGTACAQVRSWVRADRAEWDERLARLVNDWADGSGLFEAVRWPGRPHL